MVPTSSGLPVPDERSLVPFRVSSCTARSSSHPAGNLEAGGAWETDFPTERCVLVVRPPAAHHSSSGGGSGRDAGLGAAAATSSRGFVLTSLVLDTNATHVEVRGVPCGVDDHPISTRGGNGNGAALVLPRSELVGMFEHKDMQQRSGGSAARPETAVCDLTPRLALGEGGGAGPFSELHFTFLCVWEPTRAIRVERLQLGGRIAAPTPAERAPPAAHALPQLAATPVMAAAAEAAPPHTAPPDAHPAAVPRAAPRAAPLVPAASQGPGRGGCLAGCTIVLSGFLDPLRSELRDKALALGAAYSREWVPGCTHAICTVANTPKYSEVLRSGFGFTVAKEWLLAAHSTGARPPEREFFIGAGGPSSAAAAAPPASGGSALRRRGEEEKQGEEDGGASTEGQHDGLPTKKLRLVM